MARGRVTGGVRDRVVTVVVEGWWSVGLKAYGERESGERGVASKDGVTS